MTNKTVRVTLLLVIALSLGVGLVYWLGRDQPVSVIVKAAETGKVEDTVANTRAGTIKACRRAGISPRVGGQIDLMPVKEGDRVEPGQILMEFWNEDLSAQVSLAESESRSAVAKAEQACVLAQVAEREAKRLKQLKKQKLAAEEAVDKADGEARAQQAACSAARAAVQVSQAKLDVALAALDQTQLKAPFAGIVAEVNGEVGEFVTPSPVGIPTPPAVDLMDISCVYVSAPIDEVDAPGIRVGMPARIALDAFSEREFTGQVRRIAPYVLDLEKQARTVDVEVDFDVPEDCDCLLPGYSADIEIILDQREAVLRIPTEAILEGNKVLR
ncbi:MAG: efflux RND transporter periplasmic adaptor subunit, partial [Gammaproteobacteria bacterium]|nr:efflux RND transporter periplasmic adaptor subunit [Gammaproteobacteria bacterium]